MIPIYLQIHVSFIVHCRVYDKFVEMVTKRRVRADAQGKVEEAKLCKLLINSWYVFVQIFRLYTLAVILQLWFHTAKRCKTFYYQNG